MCTQSKPALNVYQEKANIILEQHNMFRLHCTTQYRWPHEVPAWDLQLHVLKLQIPPNYKTSTFVAALWTIQNAQWHNAGLYTVLYTLAIHTYRLLQP